MCLPCAFDVTCGPSFEISVGVLSIAKQQGNEDIVTLQEGCKQIQEKGIEPFIKLIGLWWCFWWCSFVPFMFALFFVTDLENQEGSFFKAKEFVRFLCVHSFAAFDVLSCRLLFMSKCLLLGVVVVIAFINFIVWCSRCAFNVSPLITQKQCTRSYRTSICGLPQFRCGRASLAEGQHVFRCGLLERMDYSMGASEASCPWSFEAVHVSGSFSFWALPQLVSPSPYPSDLQDRF